MSSEQYAPQRGRVVSGAYTITIEDLGQVLQIRTGPITLPFGLSSGFYVTLINLSGGTIQLVTPQASLRAPLGGTAMTSQWETVTLMRLFDSNDWWSGQL